MFYFFFLLIFKIKQKGMFAMSKYHVSRTGKAVICRAKGNCPLGESYATLTEVLLKVK